MLAGEIIKKEGLNKSIQDAATMKPLVAEDDGNRCCYFNGVQTELLLGNPGISSQLAPIRWGKKKRRNEP